MARWWLLLLLLCVSPDLLQALGNITFKPLRTKRYLAFPMKASVLITINLLKALNLPYMKGLNSLHELDCFVPLPHNIHTLLFDKHHQNHRTERKQLYQHLKEAISWHGLDGAECILKALCEVRTLVKGSNENLLVDILTTVFKLPDAEGDSEYQLMPANNCTMDCPLTLFDLLYRV